MFVCFNLINSVCFNNSEIDTDFYKFDEQCATVKRNSPPLKSAMSIKTRYKTNIYNNNMPNITQYKNVQYVEEEGAITSKIAHK